MFLALISTPYILIGAAASAVTLTYFSWCKGIHNLRLKLSAQETDNRREDNEDNITAGDLRRRIKQLPDVVQKYIKAVSHDVEKLADEEIVPFARSLRMEQEGELLLNGQFIDFAATEEFRTRYKHAGFVWDAVTKTQCIPNLVAMPIHVCVAYVNGAGMAKAQLPMGIPVMVAQSNTPMLNQSELMRWAAEATLFPLALMPPNINIENTDHNMSAEETALKWLPSEEGDGNSAILELKHHTTTARLFFHFNSDTNLVTSIHGTRPKLIGGKYVMTNWGCFLSDNNPKHPRDADHEHVE
eukprot:CAMPEP_0196179074 /NCGR_PEP_ID=MMETSP0911-20130528/19465_1 /TAXON_ID=49265 /ORGANISM="Thalassiosira rotula, Strain GSO102" /LENGTH=298 /DNA_ID=CAMNT_0041447729 /DNA_START=8 /DNA_END=904 /DNA_ORIENTATION=+